MDHRSFMSVELKETKPYIGAAPHAAERPMSVGVLTVHLASSGMECCRNQNAFGRRAYPAAPLRIFGPTLVLRDIVPGGVVPSTPRLLLQPRMTPDG
jgi:hypothetical protein